MSFRDCVVCQSARHAERYCQINDYDYLRCSQCGLIYVDRLERTENIYKAYSGGNLKSLRRRMMAPFRQFHHDRSFKCAMQRAEGIFSFAAGQVSGPGTYLDIGCNKCYLLAQGLERGWTVYGCELVPELTAPFLNTYPQYRHHVYHGRFTDMRPEFPKDTFDLITAIDVIEHFEDVSADLQAVLEILKPGGAFVIQTPDANCPQARQSGCDWGALKPLEHLHLFNLANLTALASRIGFSDVTGVEKAFEEADGNFVALLRKSSA